MQECAREKDEDHEKQERNVLWRTEKEPERPDAAEFVTELASDASIEPWLQTMSTIYSCLELIIVCLRFNRAIYY